MSIEKFDQVRLTEYETEYKKRESEVNNLKRQNSDLAKKNKLLDNVNEGLIKRSNELENVLEVWQGGNSHDFGSSAVLDKDSIDQARVHTDKEAAFQGSVLSKTDMAGSFLDNDKAMGKAKPKRPNSKDFVAAKKKLIGVGPEVTENKNLNL